MNYKTVLNILGKTMLLCMAFLFVPLIVNLIYKEDNLIAFLIPIGILFAIGFPCSLIKSKDRSIFVKEGFVIVALTWIILSLVGALPFFISKEIPTYIDALFETISGLTTTGASVLDSEKLNAMSKSMMFWRMFTHWIGGMGVLVFVLAIIPDINSTGIRLFSSESPGPSASKFVSKMTKTAKILYAIYIGLTFIEFIMLLFGDIGVYEALLNAFSTAGTGGFGIYGDSIMHYNSIYIEMVIASFMFLFGVNFNIYYLILIGKIGKALKSEELLTYFIIVIVSTLVIALNIMGIVGGFGQAIRYSFFQVTSISSSTGFLSYDFGSWPVLSRSILLFLTVFGACGGSTGGGIKISRLIILTKSSAAGVKKMLHPRAVTSFKLEGQVVDKETENNVKSYFLLWLLILIIATILISIDNFASGTEGSVFTNISTVLACIGNIGPSIISPMGKMGEFVNYNVFSKIVLGIVMLAGRLEILPVIALFAPRTWARGK